MDKPWYRKWFSSTRVSNVEEVQGKAVNGDAAAQFALGLNFGNSIGVNLDFVQAAHWYHKAAEQNHALAQFNLALMYARGQGVEQDDAASLLWMRKSAHLGDAGAQFNLGSRCHRASIAGIRLDDPESKIEAYKWYRLAAAQGYKDASAGYERMALSMSQEEVSEGNRRVAVFVKR